ncbi:MULTISPECIES: carboxylating nicotinate-nucleotide diphosphorylase [Acidobacterium]
MMEWKSKKIEAILEGALKEDKATRDVTTDITVDADLRASATVIARQDLTLSGLGCIPRFLEIFAALDSRKHRRYEIVSHPEMFDGVRVKNGQAIAVIRHNARVILACERVILNLMQRMSGIATMTRRYVDAIEGTEARVLDTRKTVPGLRMLDKYAVCCGGGENHRLDLSDGILIKNNHISLGGGVARVLESAHKKRQPGQTIDIEVRNFEELKTALEYGAESLLLDNMTPAEVKKAVAMVKEHDEKIPTEASGNITLENIRKYAQTGVTYISVGALTHSVMAADISMRITAEIY